MSLIKKNKQRLFPWSNPTINPWDNTMLKSFLSTDDFFDDDFFEEDSLMPAMNVKETNDKLKVELAAPGFLKKLQTLRPDWFFRIVKKKAGYHVIVLSPVEFKVEDTSQGYGGYF